MLKGELPQVATKYPELQRVLLCLLQYGKFLKLSCTKEAVLHFREATRELIVSCGVMEISKWIWSYSLIYIHFILTFSKNLIILVLGILN